MLDGFTLLKRSGAAHTWTDPCIQSFVLDTSVQDRGSGGGGWGGVGWGKVSGVLIDLSGQLGWVVGLGGVS